MIRHVLDDHTGSHQPLTVIIGDLKPELILKTYFTTLILKCSFYNSYLNHKHNFHVIETVKTEIIDEVGIQGQLRVVNFVKEIQHQHDSINRKVDVQLLILRNYHIPVINELHIERVCSAVAPDLGPG